MWRKHISCWITKATDTQWEYVIPTAFLGNNGYVNAPQCYVILTLRFLLKLTLHEATIRLCGPVDLLRAKTCDTHVTWGCRESTVCLPLAVLTEIFRLLLIALKSLATIQIPCYCYSSHTLVWSSVSMYHTQFPSMRCHHFFSLVSEAPFLLLFHPATLRYYRQYYSSFAAVLSN